MRGPNQVTSKSDVVAFINTASRRPTNRRLPARPVASVRSGHVQMSSPANAVESGKACGRALPLQELVGQSFFISRCRAAAARPGAGRSKATRTQIRRSHAPARWSIIFTRLLSRVSWSSGRLLSRAGRRVTIRGQRDAGRAGNCEMPSTANLELSHTNHLRHHCVSE